MKPIDNDHADNRTAVRIIGILVLLSGLAFMAIDAMWGFTSAL